MDKNLQSIIEKRIERTIKSLNDNRFDAHFVRSKEELFAKIDTYLSEGASCSAGGSVTLGETGVLDYLRSGKYQFYDRYAEGANVEEIFIKALSCDVYFMSTNAITEDGMLYNVDGRGNRVAPLVFGPKKIVIVSGYNKIVVNLEAAYARMKEVSGPANALRVGKSTPCTKTGRCMDCKNPERICSHALTCKYQMVPNRISVLILPGHYGY